MCMQPLKFNMTLKIEPVTRDQLKSLMRALEPLQSIILQLGAVDLAKGRGVLEGNSRCLWTKDGRRITLTPTSDGGFVGSCGRTPDPECPV